MCGPPICMGGTHCIILASSFTWQGPIRHPAQFLSYWRPLPFQMAMPPPVLTLAQCPLVFPVAERRGQTEAPVFQQKINELFCLWWSRECKSSKPQNLPGSSEAPSSHFCCRAVSWSWACVRAPLDSAHVREKRRSPLTNALINLFILLTLWAAPLSPQELSKLQPGQTPCKVNGEDQTSGCPPASECIHDTLHTQMVCRKLLKRKEYPADRVCVLGR